MIRTKKQIAEYCLPTYKKVLKECVELRYRKQISKVCEKNDVSAGICIFLACNGVGNKFTKKIFEKAVEKSSYRFMSYYCETIQSTYFKKVTKKQMLECLEKRIELLESWL